MKNAASTQATQSRKIKVRSLEFHDFAFRKLRNIKIKFADRLTVIAGHNGIGKSTILGLTTNTFGLTGSQDPKTCVGEAFFTNIEQIVHLDLNEVQVSQARPDSAPIVTAELGDLAIRKRCALTRRAQFQRARVVPRTIERSKEDPIGQDAKIPLPTIYLGMKRLAAVGESKEKEVSSVSSNMHDDDRRLMEDFIKSTIMGVQVTQQFTHQSIKGSRKKTAHPGYQLHHAFAVSLGQDSLASIATALASFQSLKRKLDDEYPGGLLVIDEMDIGFHPHAIKGLVKSLKKYASQLELQIVATTHSPILIEAVHPEGSGNPNSPDSVVYLVDTRVPRLAEDQSLAAILADMSLKEQILDSPSRPKLFLYFEDEQGKQFFEEIVPTNWKRSFAKEHKVSIKSIALGIGGSNLVQLPEKDPIFLDRVLIVDADTKIPRRIQEIGNALRFPCETGAVSSELSPENTIKAFLRKCMAQDEPRFQAALRRFRVPNPSSDLLEATFFSDGSGDSSRRENSKKWWESHWKQLKSWGVIKEWAACHNSEVTHFLQDLDVSLKTVADRLHRRGRAASHS